MKKIFTLGLILVLMGSAAIAQRGPGDRFRNHRIAEGFRNGQINRGERFRLHRDAFRLRMERRNARRDGFISPMERRKLHKMKRNERRDVYRFKHNDRRRVI